MSGFAPWVEPIAQQLQQSKQEIEKTVKQVPNEAWEKASAYAGWSYKDHVSHLPDAHRGFQGVLRAVIEGRDPDFARFARIDDINEENRRQHLATPVVELLAAFTSEAEQTQEVLSSLTPEHADFRLGPMTLGQAAQGFAMHDMAHGDEISKALQA